MLITKGAIQLKQFSCVDILGASFSWAT